MGGAGSQLPINRRKQKKWLLSQANIRMAGCGHLVSLATRMADLSAVAPYSAKAYSKNLASVWAERGRAAMEKTAIDQPTVFFATCARLIGPEVKLTIEQTLPGNLSMEDWQVMREIVAAVRQAIPDAAGAPPGAVLEHVLSALRQADAKLIG